MSSRSQTRQINPRENEGRGRDQAENLTDEESSLLLAAESIGRREEIEKEAADRGLAIVDAGRNAGLASMALGSEESGCSYAVD
jgi:hypothetical protein